MCCRSKSSSQATLVLPHPSLCSHPAEDIAGTIFHHVVIAPAILVSPVNADCSEITKEHTRCVCMCCRCCMQLLHSLALLSVQWWLVTCNPTSLAGACTHDFQALCLKCSSLYVVVCAILLLLLSVKVTVVPILSCCPNRACATAL